MKKSLIVLALLAAVSAWANVDPATTELRYCGAPKRDTHGNIIRRADVLAAFQKAHPCPVTGKTTGACAGWAKDHIVPLACGGCDAVSNLQWLPDGLKSVAGTISKDRFERLVYAATPPIADTAACHLQVIPPAAPASSAK